MYKPFLFCLLLFFSCTLPAEREAIENAKQSETTVLENTEVNAAQQLPADTLAIAPVVQRIKKPSGIYRSVLPLTDKIEQTILFNNDFTYRLQERYTEKKDSTVITEGTWTPSDGFIWLYKDQIVRGRYKWKDNTLQYYSPVAKKGFAMNHLQDAIQNAAWRNKGKQGVILFAVGNEPFWHAEYDTKDSVSFLLSEWEQPLRIKVKSFFSSQDSLGYTAINDSVQLRVTVFPQFCSDGMSDYTYRNKVKVVLNEHVYHGCGIIYK